jgi:hypothetical protein
VKQLADQHNTKMQQSQQKLQMDAAKQQAEQQAQSQMQQGGLYATPPDMSGKNPQPGKPAGGMGGGMGAGPTQ